MKCLYLVCLGFAKPHIIMLSISGYFLLAPYYCLPQALVGKCWAEYLHVFKNGQKKADCRRGIAGLPHHMNGLRCHPDSLTSSTILRHKSMRHSVIMVILIVDQYVGHLISGFDSFIVSPALFPSKVGQFFQLLTWLQISVPH